MLLSIEDLQALGRDAGRMPEPGTGPVEELREAARQVLLMAEQLLRAEAEFLQARGKKHRGINNPIEQARATEFMTEAALGLKLGAYVTYLRLEAEARVRRERAA